MNDRISLMLLFSFLFNISAVLADTALEHKKQGDLYYKQNSPELALEEYNKVIEIDPLFAQAYNNRGVVLAQQGRREEALQDFSRAVDLNPNDPQAFFNRGQTLAKEEKLHEAVNDLSRAIVLKPEYGKAYNLRAVAYYHLKEYDKAWADVRKAEELGVNVNLDFINDLMGASNR